MSARMGGLAAASLHRLSGSKNPKERKRERTALLPDMPTPDASPRRPPVRSESTLFLSADQTREWLGKDGYTFIQVNTLNKHVRKVAKKDFPKREKFEVKTTHVAPWVAGITSEKMIDNARDGQ